MINLEENNVETLLEVNNDHWTSQYKNLESLKNKQFFKTLIEEGYFKDYVFELVNSLLDDGENRTIILERLVGVAKLNQYFSMVEALSTTEETYEDTLTKREVEGRNKAVRLNAALEEAEKDEDFKKLIMDSYFTSYALDQTSLLTNESIIRNGHRKDVLEALSGVSVLRNYVVDVHKNVVELSSEEEYDDEDLEG